MRWISLKDRRIKKIMKLKNWQLWFAWRPVKLNDPESKIKETIWLEKIYRRIKWPNKHESSIVYYTVNPYEIAEALIKKKKIVYEYCELTTIITTEFDQENK